MTLRTKRCIADLERLPDALREKADRLIDRLQDEPSLGKKLKGKLEGKRSLRLGRTHRIIYVTEPSLIVLSVSPRKDSYK